MLRWSWPRDRWERAILVGTAIAVVVAGSAVVATLRARAAVHKAAIASLRNYAAVGMEQFVNGYESLLRQSFVPIMPPTDYVEPLGPRDPLPVSDMVATIARLQRDPCRCLIAPGPSAIFRLGLSSADTAVVDSLGRPLAGLDSLVTDVVRRQADSLTRAGWRYAFQVTPTGVGGAQFVFFTVRTDSVTGRRYAYGFAIPAAHMVERVFRPAFASLRIIPRHLLSVVSRNDEFISLDLEKPGGQAFFSTTPTYPDGASDVLTMPALRGGLAVRAHLNPRIKDALIPGGIPPKVPVREVGLVGLSLGLLIAIAALGLRVGALARLRSDLASSVTHELRTPLTQIRLAAETVLLGRSPTPEAERRSLASIVDETKRLQQLIDNVLHFSRAERQMTRVRLEPVELRSVVERAAGDLAPLVAGRGIVLRVDIPGEVIVQGNANALRQIVLNLVDNGARYGPDSQTIVVGAAAQDGHVELWVQDRGPGVPVADRQRVWDAFVRLDRDRDSVVTGTGLGLTVVRELVEAQGGGCWIEDTAGEGARVVVRLARGSTPP
ncbi:MAG: HAMP domain-containing sensor histidine kinase [Gemmatimonadales bacterium]